MWKRYALYLLLLLFGIILLLYPAVSNYLYEQKQDTVLTRYETLARDSALNQARREALEKARAYNRQLASGTVSLADPFLTATLPTADGGQRSVLDLDGTGVIASLAIDRLKLLLPIYYGTDNATLERGIGVLEGTSLPVGGVGTHTVLCGHSGLSSARLFTDLEQLEVGDCFSLSVLGEELWYQVDQIETVLPDKVDALAIEPEQDYCTLLTCTPYGVNTHRLLVRGVRTQAPMEAEDATEETVDAEPQLSVWLREYLCALAAGLALTVFCGAVFLLLRSFYRRVRSLP